MQYLNEPMVTESIVLQFHLLQSIQLRNTTIVQND